MLNLKEVLKETNEKLESEGLDTFTMDEFVVEISFAMCQWLERHPEAVR